MNEEALDTIQPSAFGRRKIVPRALIVDDKPHVRQFMCDCLEELHFIASGCAVPGELELALDTLLPDLVLVGTRSGDPQGRDMLMLLAMRKFAGQVLLFGTATAPLTDALHELGTTLGLDMLPVLPAPFNDASLRNAVAAFIPHELPPHPAIDVREALAIGYLELCYQPRIDAETLRLSGAEALMRLRHPSWGIMPPAGFKPADGGVHAGALCEFILARLCEDWHYFAAEHCPVEIAVNLQMPLVLHLAALDSLARLLPEHPAFDGLIVELNADAVVHDLAEAKSIARRLRAHNIGLSIAGLGEEWPLLVGQNDFPFVEIQCDRQFVCGCAGERLKRYVCRQIFELADGFGARAVAQGVETQDDFHAVREIGFDHIQGPLFAKPMTAQKFAREAQRRSRLLPPQ